MSPSLVTRNGGRQACCSNKPRLVLKTINIVIEDVVDENEEVTLWYDAKEQEQPSRGVRKSTFFKSCMQGENEEATGRNKIMIDSVLSLSTSSTGAPCSISNLQPAQHLFSMGINYQLQPRNSSTTIINDHPNYKLMPMPAGCTSSINQLNLNKRPQTAAKRIFWGEEVPLMAVPVLPSKTAAGTTNTAQHHPLFKSMIKDTDISYSMTASHSLLISIKPVKCGNAGADSDDGSTNASHYLQRHPRRLLELSSLLNFFQLLVPDGVGDGDGSSMDSQKVQKLQFIKSPYFLTLLDSSMPRVTNCGYYYRMRYAVYVMVSTPSSAASSVSQKFVDHQLGHHSGRDGIKAPLLQPFQLKVFPPASACQISDYLVLHIGELHVYTIFPKEGGGRKGEKSSIKDADGSSQYYPKWCHPGHIHYENVSFFANTAPLTGEELAAIRPITASDISTMVFNLRRTLKLLNSILINPVNGEMRLEQQQSQKPQLVESDESYQHTLESTLLLEQLKYPKSSADFTCTDRTIQQFVRNQLEMFSNYQAHYSKADGAANLGDCNQEIVKKFLSAVAAIPVEKKLLPVTLTASNNGNGNKEAKNDADWSTADDFLCKLHRLRNQATVSKRISKKRAADMD